MKLGLQLVVVLSCWVCLRASAQNLLGQLTTGALEMGQKMLSDMQEGSIFGQKMNIESQFISARSETAVGYGTAMRQPGNAGSEESYERRRRRRRSKRSENLVLHRKKRSPCWNMMGATTESPDDVDERRRARKRAVNNRTKSRVSKPTTKKKLQESQRSRRQAAQNDQALEATLGQRVTGMMLSFVDNVADVMQQMRQKIRGAASNANGAGQP